MRLFALERYFSKYEFAAKHILSASDCESLSVHELLSLADAECRDLWNDLRLGYTETLGHPLLLNAISRLYKTVTSKQVLVAAPQELIFLAFNVLLSRGNQILVTTPAYQSLHEIAASIGCEVKEWTLRPTSRGWKLDIQFLADHVSNATKLIVINFPHNPTGHQISLEVQHEIIRVAEKYGIPIFSDEMYRGSEYHTEDQLPAIVDEYDRGISLWGLSKSFGLPGLRIGWLAAKDSVFLAKCSQLRDYLTICNSAPSEILGMIAVRGKENILERTREILSENLAKADTFFSAHIESFDWLRPKAGSVAFPIMKNQNSIEDFCEKLVQRKGLLITPGSLFQYPGNHFRIGIGRRSFSSALGILEQYLREA